MTIKIHVIDYAPKTEVTLTRSEYNKYLNDYRVMAEWHEAYFFDPPSQTFEEYVLMKERAKNGD